MLTSNKRLRSFTAMPHFHVLGKTTNLSSKRSSTSWYTISRSPPPMTSYACSARSPGIPDSIGHGVIHAVSTKQTISCSKKRWSPCSGGEGSAVTIVFLRGVHSPARRGDLVRSIWNTRAWPFQEYHASKVVRFYTEDWTPYLSLNIPNHKDSPEIIAEMEQATGISERTLTALRPGLDHIREKLCLALRRETTYVDRGCSILITWNLRCLHFNYIR